MLRKKSIKIEVKIKDKEELVEARRRNAFATTIASVGTVALLRQLVRSGKDPSSQAHASASPRKTFSIPSSLMEVEVKLRLANVDTNVLCHVTTLLSPRHVVTHRQQNLFFDDVASELSALRVVLHLRFYGDDEQCVASLKAQTVLVDSMSRMEEDDKDRTCMRGGADKVRVGGV